MEIHDGVDSAAVAFPDGTESRLTSDIPNFEGYSAFGYLSHIETDCRDHIFSEFASLNET